jgi:site-specific recombinase XerD
MDNGHKSENRRIDAMVRRFVKFSAKDDRKHQERMQALDRTIKQLAAAQIITEEKLQRFISSLSSNGFGSRS